VTDFLGRFREDADFSTWRAEGSRSSTCGTKGLQAFAGVGVGTGMEGKTGRALLPEKLGILIFVFTNESKLHSNMKVLSSFYLL